MNLTSDICSLISSYIYKPKYELLDWISINDLDWSWLSCNPNAI